MDTRTQELLMDQTFVKSILQMEPNDVQKEIEKQGGSISVDEIIEYGNRINAILSKSDEFNECDLETVTGGKAKDACWWLAGIAVGIGVMALPW